MNRQRLEQAIEGYFSDCDATREQIVKKSGEVITWQRPYTIYGLCAAVGLTAEEMLALRDGRGKKDCCALIRRALHRIAAYTLEQALLGDFSWQVATTALKELGLIPQTSEEETGEIRITMDGAAREASV